MNPQKLEQDLAQLIRKHGVRYAVITFVDYSEKRVAIIGVGEPAFQKSGEYLVDVITTAIEEIAVE